MTTDELIRRGLGGYDPSCSRDYDWFRSVHYFVVVNATSVLTPFKGDPGVIAWKREP